MAGYSITTEGEEALVAATVETLLIVAGSTTRKGVIRAFTVSFDGVVSADAPVQVKIKRGNSASQGTSSAATEEKNDPDSPAASCTGFHSFTAEPTYTGQPLRHIEVHPQGGIFRDQLIEAPRDGWYLDDSTNSFIGVEVTAPAVVNVAADVQWEE